MFVPMSLALGLQPSGTCMLVVATLVRMPLFLAHGLSQPFGSAAARWDMYRALNVCFVGYRRVHARRMAQLLLVAKSLLAHGTVVIPLISSISQSVVSQSSVWPLLSVCLPVSLSVSFCLLVSLCALARFLGGLSSLSLG